MDTQADILMALSYKAADEGDFILANTLMDQAEDLMVAVMWSSEAN